MKDLSVTQLVSSCFQEKKKSVAYKTLASDAWHTSRVRGPQRGLATAVMAVRAVSHTRGAPRHRTPGDIRVWETRYRRSLSMYPKTLPGASALTCHCLALPTSEHSVLGVVSERGLVCCFTVLIHSYLHGCPLHRTPCFAQAFSPVLFLDHPSVLDGRPWHWGPVDINITNNSARQQQTAPDLAFASLASERSKCRRVIFA